MVPNKLYAGTRWLWKVTPRDAAGNSFSAADGWSVKYIFTNAAGAFSFTDDGTATGNEFQIDVDAATTGAYTAGDYTWNLFAVKGVDERMLDTCPVNVVADITGGSTALDQRSHVKKTLDALEATIEGKAGKDQLSYSIAGRSLSRFSTEELIKWRATYRALYQEECNAARVAAGDGNPRNISIHFPGVS